MGWAWDNFGPVKSISIYFEPYINEIKASIFFTSGVFLANGMADFLAKQGVNGVDLYIDGS